MHDLGSLGGNYSSAFGINNSGQVVGESYTANGFVDDAFLYSNGTMLDLNSMIPASSGWQLTEACAINDHGWIVGAGFNPSGQDHAFLLTPVPEPSTLALLAAGAIGLLGFAWRRQTV
jgi:probable HAF family extracellular repeat protein